MKEISKYWKHEEGGVKKVSNHTYLYELIV